MSLIIASHYKDSINILSDTKLTYLARDIKSLKENHYNTGIVKVKFITENIVVAWAGEISCAQDTFEAIDGLTDLEEICDTLRFMHIASMYIDGRKPFDEPRIDFIVAFNSENAKELISIKNKRVNRRVKKAFIGDTDAYNDYLKYNDSGEDMIEKQYLQFTIVALDEDTTSDSFINRNVFVDIINSEKHNTVGGILIHLQSVNNTFKFLEFNELINYEEQFEGKPNEWKVVKLGNEQTGSCFTSVFESSENCVAVYIDEANLGIIFEEADDLIMRPKYYSNYSIIKFKRLVNSNYPSLNLSVNKEIKIKTYFKEIEENLDNSNQKYKNLKYANEDLKNIECRLLEPVRIKFGIDVNLENHQIWQSFGLDWNWYYLFFLYYGSIYYDNIDDNQSLIENSKLILKLSTQLIVNNDNIKEIKDDIKTITKNVAIILNHNKYSNYNLLNEYSAFHNFLEL